MLNKWIASQNAALRGDENCIELCDGSHLCYKSNINYDLDIANFLVISFQIRYIEVFDLTNPRFNEQIWLVPSDFVKSRFHCTKHQVILPHGHPEVAKMVLDLHKILVHVGPESTLSTLRQKIWLTQGRREVKRVIRRCVACQKQRVGPCAQKMGPLPEERVSCSPAFAHVGTDFAGPLYVKEGSTIQKVYVCLFTCASSRMIHLELTHSLTTDEFLQAFSRMTSRRGLCHTVWSDNAKTFKAASKEIQKLYDPSTQSRTVWDTLDRNRINSELSSKRITWKFIAQRSPWRGGWWERFFRAINESALSAWKSTSHLFWVEHTINSNWRHHQLATINSSERRLQRPFTGYICSSCNW